MIKNFGDMVIKIDDKCCSLFKFWIYEGMKKILCFRLVNNKV